ncbi:unnamed protein product [Dovyalis caffra]|uniref:Uncharacterized protein n=1 Tax=Dovyalis caffra TaxID=77055 RepID=A0AAV1SUJ8_9ROSI|nr:unnamed protein product [Dovyalis caffra]
MIPKAYQVIIMDDDLWDHRRGNHASLNRSNDVSQRQWRKFVLDHMYQSLSNDKEGMQGFFRDVLMMAVKIYAAIKLDQLNGPEKRKINPETKEQKRRGRNLEATKAKKITESQKTEEKNSNKWRGKKA